MKKKEIITTEKFVDVSDSDIVDDFMTNEFLSSDWIEEYNYPTVDSYDYFWEDYNLTEEDKKRIFSLIINESKKRVNEIKEDEKSFLKDRKSIINFITGSIDTCYMDEGEVGYLLSPEEILDIILENGRK